MINWKTWAIFITFNIISFALGAGAVKELILPAEIALAKQEGQAIGWNDAVSKVEQWYKPKK